MTTSTTPDVRPGQIWADNDFRVEGRTLRVDSVDETHATCTVVTNDHVTQRGIDRSVRGYYDRRGKNTRIKLTRFRPTSTGYRLVQDVEVSS